MVSSKLRTFVLSAALGLVPAAHAQDASGRIGVLTSLSGGSADFGIRVQHAVEIAKEDLSANGLSLDVFYEDHQAQVPLGQAGFEKLIDQYDTSVVLANVTPVLLAIGPVANERKRVIVNIGGSAPELVELKPMVVHMSPTAIVDARELALYVREGLGKDTASIIHVNDQYGISFQRIFQNEFEALGGKTLSVEAYEPNAVNMRTQLLKIKSLQPGAVVSVSGITENGYIAAQAREIGLEAKILGNTFMLHAKNFEIARDAMNGLLGVTYRFDAESSPKAKEFAEAFSARYGQTPVATDAFAYDSTMLVGEAIGKVGSDPEAIRDYIVSVKDWPGVMGALNFDDNGMVLLNSWRFEIVDGETVFTEAAN